MLTPSLRGMSGRQRWGGVAGDAALAGRLLLLATGAPARAGAAFVRGRTLVAGNSKLNGNPGDSSQTENAASSKPVKPTCDRRTSASSCGPVWVISVAELPSFGPMAESQRWDGLLVEGGARPLRMAAS